MWPTHEQGSLVVLQFIFFTYAHSLTIPTTNRVIFYLLVQNDVKSTKRWSMEMDISWLMKISLSEQTKNFMRSAELPVSAEKKIFQ